MMKLYLNIVFLFMFTTTAYAQWLCPWENRIPITITETSGSNLSNHQVKLDIAFLNGMNTDFSDLQFTANDGTSTLDYWIEISTPSTSAIVWVELPTLNANSTTIIYQYYSNPTANSASNGPNTFVFFDHFDTFQGWSDYGTGTINVDDTTIPGTSLLAKLDDCDPNGGFKPLGTTLNEFRLISREIRLNQDGSGCSWNRYGLEDANFNGYTIRRNADSANNSKQFGSERRNGGNASNVFDTNMNHPRDIWYRTELRRCAATTDNLIAILYNDDRSEIGTVNNTDQTYASFDRVTVRGGRPYYIDFMAVANFTCSEPTYVIGTVEKNLPTAICQDITVELDSAGEAIIVPSDVDNGSSDECGIDSWDLSQSLFDCSHLGENEVTLKLADEHGNTTTCLATITVVDTIAPVFSCPQNIIIEANTTDCAAIVNWTTPTLRDNCIGAELDSNYDSGDVFPLGTTIVRYKATDDSGNYSSCSFSVTVESNLSAPTISVTDTSGLNNDDGIICAGSSATLSGAVGYVAYSWSNGDNTPTTTISVAGNYELTVTDNIGCINIADVDVTVNALPTAGTCNLIHDLCQENTGGITVEASGGLAPYTVNWSPNVGISTTQTILNNGGQLTITNIPGGSSLNISVTDANGCTLE